MLNPVGRAGRRLPRRRDTRGSFDVDDVRQPELRPLDPRCGRQGTGKGMALFVDIEMSRLVAPRGVASASVKQLRDISGAGRMGRKVAQTVSEDLASAGIRHLPVEIPQDQNERVLMWLWHEDDHQGMPVVAVAPFLNTIHELAVQRDLDQATVICLAEAADAATAP